MVDKVDIVQDENNISLEEQSKKQEETNSQTTPEAQTKETSSEKPSWLPDKFSNAEELAKAYGELEKKLSSKVTTCFMKLTL